MSRRRDLNSSGPRSRQQTAQFPAYKSTRFERVLAAILLTGAAIVPVTVSLEGAATFRLPNQLALYTVAIVAMTVAAAGFITLPGRFTEARERLRTPALLAFGGIGWTAVSALFSSNRALALHALVYVVCLSAIGLIGAYALRPVSVSVLAAAMFIPAVINVGVITLQALKIWNPWVFSAGTYERAQKNALLGNPNDVGAYLVAPTILAAALAVTSKRHRGLYIAATALFAAGMLMSETLTAVGSTLIALIVLSLRRNLKRGFIASVLLIAIVSMVTLLYSPMRNRLARVTGAMHVEQVDRMLNGRLPAFFAAWQMFRANPLTGVGPGAFKFEYMPARIALDDRYAAQFAPEYAGVNFGEVHNDHLQLLAESGLPGYLLFLAVVAVVGAIGLRQADDNDHFRVVTARLLALPLCAGLLVTMITGFPLQLAASAYTFTLAGAACLAWNRVGDVS